MSIHNIEKLIDEPLSIAVESNLKLTKSTVDFITNQNFDKSPRFSRTVDFKHTNKTDILNKILNKDKD